ncbi:MAG: DUF2971 domain-containing protein [Bacteroidota bacterium]
MTEIPQILYKYRDWKDDYHKRLLTENELFLASASQFNDPFDVSLPYRYRKEDLTPANLFQKLYETAKEMYPDYIDEQIHEICYERQQSGVFENGQYWKENHEEFREKMHSIFGVLSLTTENDNLLMWSHYSDSHKGFCIGLDSSEIYKAIGGMFGKVIHSDRFPEIPLFGDPTNTMIEILTTKSTHWEYEEEYRLTKAYSAKTSHILPNEAFKEIILGVNISEQFADEIIQLVKTKFPNMKIYQSQMNLEEFKLDLIPIL